MTAAYFDAGALVKLVVEEDGSADAAGPWDAADSVLTSRVANPESMLLGGFGAVHLASALTLTELPVILATWDARLHRAARASGLAIAAAALNRAPRDGWSRTVLVAVVAGRRPSRSRRRSFSPHVVGRPSPR